MITPTPQQISALEASGHFDAEWYRCKNNDIDLLKIDPALHYLIYGHRMGRDPGPNFSTIFARHAWRIKDVHEPIAWLAHLEKRTGCAPVPDRTKILAAAAAAGRSGEHERAIELACQHIPKDLAYTLEILRANMALRRGDEAAWLDHLNAYLAHFGVATVRLASGPGSRYGRLVSSDHVPVISGPLVSVIMPAWNAAETIEHAAGSILGQSWQNLELLIVDDMSDDGTWSVIQRIAARDKRVHAIRNKVNVGPYVSKNIALGMAKGEWITGHDADDWALPDRIERHVRAAQDRGLKASVTDMLRVRENGEVTHLNGITAFCFDGVARRASISCLFEKETLRDRLGFWDSVRYGGDSEMIVRAQALLGDKFAFIHDIGMICLNHAASLTNNAFSGVGEIGMAPSRVAYKETWKHLYTPGMEPSLAYLLFPQQTRRHNAPADMVVPLADIRANLGADQPLPPARQSTMRQDAGLAKPPTTRADGDRIAAFRFRRADGKPFRILARGDCTSFRSVHLNKDLFPDGVEFIQAQKSPFMMINEAAAGVTVTRDVLDELSDVSLMPGSLSRHYLGQSDRGILTANDADLIMLDTWADMNFELWRSNEHGWTVWVHPRFLRDPAGFRAAHTNIGRQTLEQSLDEAERLVEILRRANSGVPVLILNQQTDYYPKMDARREYYTFGPKLAMRVPDAWFGGVIASADLETADMDSCGPGNTLHFQAQTYRRMIAHALAMGMMKRFDPSRKKPRAPAAPDVTRPKMAGTGSGDPDATPDRPARTGASPQGVPAQDAPHRATAAAALPVGSVRDALTFAADNPEHVPYPVCQVAIPSDAQQSLSQYVLTSPDAGPTRWTPAVIEVRAGGYADWERAVNKRYARVRMKRRSERAGHVVDRFNPRLHVPDMHEIHHSTYTRSGGKMRGNYLKTVDEMGGAPSQYLAPHEPSDPADWVQCFGVFKPLPGHRQGEVDVGRQLLSYISARRMGDVLLYSQLMGHDAYLADGVMYHVHFHVVNTTMDSGDPFFDGIKFIMYGGVGNGGAGLWQWKRTAGFTPMRLVTFPWTEGGAGAD